jgi:hypothetical protein
MMLILSWLTGFSEIWKLKELVWNLNDMTSLAPVRKQSLPVTVSVTFKLR